MRFRFALYILATFTAVIPVSPCSAERPNIILLMCDDLGYGDVQCFNPDSPIQTPHINAMAARGLKFKRFYSAGPVCSPTRGSCLTGRHSYRYGIYTANTGHMRMQEITLPELLQQQGYTTGHFGKWHLGTLTKTIRDANRGGPTGAIHFAPPRNHGYHQSFVTESKVPTFDPMISPQRHNSKAWDAMSDTTNSKPYGTRYWNHNGTPATDALNGDDSKIIMDRAIPFIEQAVDSKAPFFAAIWFHAPHLPVVAGERHVAAYQQFDVYTRNYYGCITAMDEQVGRLRNTLRTLNVAENTMLWFCSDNGPEGKSGNSPGSAGLFRGRKRSLYEGGVRVPAILEWPARVQPSETDFAAVTSDYLPTILDVLGVEYPDTRPLDGTSLIKALSGASTERESPIGFQSGKQIAWHSGKYKIYTNNSGNSWELYNLHLDPGEKRDLFHQYAALVETLAKECQTWQLSCKASDRDEDY